MLAPSMQTCPPCLCTISIISVMVFSYLPLVEGKVIIKAASSCQYFSALAARSSMSTLPLMVLTTTIFIPARAALAGLVPWADLGIRQTLRCDWSVLSRYFMMVRSPVYSPEAPELGWKEISSKPVMDLRYFLSSSIMKRQPLAWSGGTNGWISSWGQVRGIISLAALSFMVQLPREIIDRFKLISFSWRERKYRIIWVSECTPLKILWNMNLSFLMRLGKNMQAISSIEPMFSSS